jgi:rhodanese-related sulfurtransferase
LKLKKIFFHVLLIAALCTLFGLGINARLIKRYIQGEFQHGFLSTEEFTSISFISLLEAEDLFAGQLALFIDSREAEAFKGGHIVGAMNIPYTKPGLTSLPDDLPAWRARTLVIYCDGSECRSSVALAKFLHSKGCTDLRVFFGGWDEWLRIGLPVEREDDQ